MQRVWSILPEVGADTAKSADGSRAEYSVVYDGEKTELCIKTDDYILLCPCEGRLSPEQGRQYASAVARFTNDGRLTALLIGRGLQLATMESCTSGLAASGVTDFAGSSAVLHGSDITYSNEAKAAAGVSRDVLERFGVYSAQTACAMASRAREKYRANIGIGVTGTFSNPDPNNPDSVTGEVHIGIDCGGTVGAARLTLQSLDRSRRELKQGTADIALSLVYAALTQGVRLSLSAHQRSDGTVL